MLLLTVAGGSVLLSCSADDGEGRTQEPLPLSVELVSVASDGTQGRPPTCCDSFTSCCPSISADGRHITFQSLASNLVADDTNGVFDVFVHDRLTGITERVSLSTEGIQGNFDSTAPAISADGRFVAFESFATNLLPEEANSVQDIFVRDRQTGALEVVSVASGGSQAILASSQASISADGRFVAFVSLAFNLVTGDTNNTEDIFVHDRQTGVTERVTLASDGTQVNSVISNPSISADGRFVAFDSLATNLVPGDTNNGDIFVRDRRAGVTERVSTSSDGTQGNGPSLGASISANGRYVVFVSFASNLVDGDSNGREDVFVNDRETGATELVNMDSQGVQGRGFIDEVSISADGRYVSFRSDGANLAPADTNRSHDVFVHDRQRGLTVRVSLASDGTQGNDGSFSPVVSGQGRHIAFTSYASTLVTGDNNDKEDIFVATNPLMEE